MLKRQKSIYYVLISLDVPRGKVCLMNQEIKLYHYVPTEISHMSLSYTEHFVHMISNPPNIPAKTPSPRKWGNLPHTGQREGMAIGLPLGWPAPEPALLPLPHTMSSPTFLLVQKLLILENHRKLWDTKDLTYNQSRWNIKNKTKARSYKSICITLSKVFLYEAYSDNVSWLTGFGNIFKIGSNITYKTQSHYFKV